MNNNSEAAAIILIIERDAERAAQLKDMIEFLDQPAVCVADDGAWQDAAASSNLTAIFIGNGLGEDRARQVAAEVQDRHPGVPLVVVEPDDG